MTSEQHREPPVDPSGIEEPHDTLAADSFAIPAPDPHSPAALPVDPTGSSEAHDTLAADEFAIPGPDPHSASAQARAVPSDAAGIAEPHDTLAAEEFAIPASGGAGRARTSPPRSWPARALLAAPALALAAWAVRRRRGR